MQKVIVYVDWYTKIILILIAILLVGILIKPSITPVSVSASPSPNYYVWVQGGKIKIDASYFRPVPVKVVNWPR